MITEKDYNFIVKYDQQKQTNLPEEQPEACADVFINLITHISRDQTIQYILVMIDDILSVIYF